MISNVYFSNKHLDKEVNLNKSVENNNIKSN